MDQTKTGLVRGDIEAGPADLVAVGPAACSGSSIFRDLFNWAR